jgi:probable HAF family extracellular repeat protein
VGRRGHCDTPWKGVFVRPLMGGIALLVFVGACNEPTRPEETAATLGPVGSASAAPRFTIRSLGTGPFSFATGINERGEVIIDDDLQAVLWRAGQLQNLGHLGGGISRPRDINDEGAVVGFSARPNGQLRAFLWTADGGMRGLGTLGGTHSDANAINNRREVVGTSSIAPSQDLRAFLWKPGQGMRSLGTLGGAGSVAQDINDLSQVVGSSGTASGAEHAFIWTAQRGMEDIHPPGGRISEALGISPTGVVVGYVRSEASEDEAFLWTRAGGVRRLGNLGGPGSMAFSINSHRRVVGISLLETGQFAAFLWTPERGMQALRTLGAEVGGAETNLGQALDLNEFGVIVGQASNANNKERAAIWRPVQGPLLVGD